MGFRMLIAHPCAVCCMLCKIMKQKQNLPIYLMLYNMLDEIVSHRFQKYVQRAARDAKNTIGRRRWIKCIAPYIHNTRMDGRRRSRARHWAQQRQHNKRNGKMYFICAHHHLMLWYQSDALDEARANRCRYMRNPFWPIEKSRMLCVLCLRRIGTKLVGC